MYYHDVSRFDSEKPRGLLDRDAALVHEGLGLQQYAGALFQEQSVEFGLPGTEESKFFQNPVTYHEPDVVAGLTVLDSGIPQKDYHLRHT